MNSRHISVSTSSTRLLFKLTGTYVGLHILAGGILGGCKAYSELLQEKTVNIYDISKKFSYRIFTGVLTGGFVSFTTPLSHSLISLILYKNHYDK